MVLDGLESMLNKRFRKHYENGIYVNPKVNLVRYADYTEVETMPKLSFRYRKYQRFRIKISA